MMCGCQRFIYMISAEVLQLAKSDKRETKKARPLLRLTVLVSLFTS